jgi:hypothetical protein
MAKHKVAVTWEMCGYVEVEADNLEQAMKKVKKDPEEFDFPDDAEYVDGSFVLSTDDVDEMAALCDFCSDGGY